MAPLVGGEAVKGPLTKMMHELGLKASIDGIASLYADFLDILVIDPQDECDASALCTDSIEIDMIKTLMKTPDERITLAQHVLARLKNLSSDGSKQVPSDRKGHVYALS